jgi:hypothetical protein
VKLAYFIARFHLPSHGCVPGDTCEVVLFEPSERKTFACYESIGPKSGVHCSRPMLEVHYSARRADAPALGGEFFLLWSI